jgi:hypothetical protein
MGGLKHQKAKRSMDHLLQHVPTAMNRDSQDTPEVRV